MFISLRVSAAMGWLEDRSLEEHMSECTNQKGFNLIELLVAMGILLVGTLAVASMLMTSSSNTIFSNQDRGGDTIALELVEVLRGEMAQRTFGELPNLRLEKLIPGSTTRYEYRDAASSTTGVSGPTGQYVQRTGSGVGTGTPYIYKWRIDDRRTEFSHPDGMLRLEVTVGWNDKKHGSDDCKYPCGNTTCSGYTGDPGDPGAPDRTCARCTKMTNWVIQSKN
jgi:prepilin-type N-terminal cleavage/methylation domain-containing protein